MKVVFWSCTVYITYQQEHLHFIIFEMHKYAKNRTFSYWFMMELHYFFFIFTTNPFILIFTHHFIIKCDVCIKFLHIISSSQQLSVNTNGITAFFDRITLKWKYSSLQMNLLSTCCYVDLTWLWKICLVSY